MAEPTAAIRAAVLERDNGRCWSCGTRDRLTFQHRRAVGMGGSPVRPIIADGIAACIVCNGRFESDLQTVALEKGWKVRRWVRFPERVPVWDFVTHQWYRLDPFRPIRFPIRSRVARDMMRRVYGPDGPVGVEA